MFHQKRFVESSYSYVKCCFCLVGAWLSIDSAAVVVSDFCVLTLISCFVHLLRAVSETISLAKP